MEKYMKFLVFILVFCTSLSVFSSSKLVKNFDQKLYNPADLKVSDLYFEVHQIIENQLFVGKNPDYAYGDNEYLKKFGTSLSINLDAHLVRPDVVGIKQTRL